MIDWRLPENRREALQRSYTFSLKHKSFPGMVYSFLPGIADAFGLDDDQRAWLVWLNGNTQNAVSSLLLLEAAPRAEDWRKAVAFWDKHFRELEWDTDRRHQKAKFGVATEQWVSLPSGGAADGWRFAAEGGWESVWRYSKGQPYMGRLSAWSMYEYARILLGPEIPDIGNWMLDDKSGSKSHRNALAFVKGYESIYWDESAPDLLGITDELAAFGNELLAEAERRNVVDKTCRWCDGLGCESCMNIGTWVERHPDVSRLTLESALCTYKSWHKPNRRYPNVYADMMYNRIRKAEARFGRRLPLLWDLRRRDLPEYLRLEDCPSDPGFVPEKQNHYLKTGCPVMLHREWPDMDDGFMIAGRRPLRKEPTWTL